MPMARRRHTRRQASSPPGAQRRGTRRTARPAAAPRPARRPARTRPGRRRGPATSLPHKMATAASRCRTDANGRGAGGASSRIPVQSRRDRTVHAAAHEPPAPEQEPARRAPGSTPDAVAVGAWSRAPHRREPARIAGSRTSAPPEERSAAEGCRAAGPHEPVQRSPSKPVRKGWWQRRFTGE